MNIDKKNLLVNAKQILNNKWRGTHTVPSPNLYPHQWSLDSAFISIGFSIYNQEKTQPVLPMFEEHGFYEYYNPLTSQDLGADNFSWTAALIIDLIYEENNIS